MRPPNLCASMARPDLLVDDMEVEPLACNTGGVALDDWHIASQAVVQNRNGEQPGVVIC